MARLKIRFDVFKRDGFTCQYCGRTPPAVVLELDHIIPKCQGGADTIDNYITACFECNRGKAGESLDVAPAAIDAKIELLEEKRMQLREFNQLIEEREAELLAGVNSVIEIFQATFPKEQPTERFSQTTIKRFVSLLPVCKVRDAMVLACTLKPSDGDIALRYFCGICWNWVKKPETRNW